uniref:Ribosomal protein L19 n=1 Tax=Neogoniolithon spectabile TaxID=231755 RepID=A0A3G3MGP1_9FLOR|nr:ribosomal protein L19 [Neogoniolithon spectabile]AYR05997.1 ribosomal protein L19 [Neogoniolithon spectabile]
MTRLDKQLTIKQIEDYYLRNNIPKIEVGDLIKIGVTIQEGNKERTQFIEGIVISIHKAYLNSTITIRKIFQGIGVEKSISYSFPENPEHKDYEKKSKVRRAKLYYLRNRIGKATRLKTKN